MNRKFLRLILAIYATLPLYVYSNSPAISDTLVVEVENISSTSCFGSSDGEILLTVQGIPPFTFQWSNGDTTQNISNLSAGTYSVVVQDSTGTQVTLEGIEVTQPEQLKFLFGSIYYPGCNGTTGALTVEVAGGTPGYSFSWSNGQTTENIDDLEAGDYGVTATDANGCSTSLSISLQPQFPAVSLVTSGHLTCVQSEVKLDGTASAAGDHFSFQWTATPGGQFSQPTDSLVTAADAPGTYTLEVTNLSNGCVSAISANIITDTITPVANAGQDTIVLCTNSELELNGSATNGSNFEYLWSVSGGGLILSGESTLTPTVRNEDVYVLTVTNSANGCSNSSFVLVSGANEPPSANVFDGEITCLFPEAQLKVETGASDVVYLWNGPNGFTSDELSPAVSVPGEYIFTLTDTLTTCSDHFSAEILDNTTPPALAVTGGTITCTSQTMVLTSFTSSHNATFNWSGPNGFSSGEQNPEVGKAGDYTLVLTDTMTGCTATAIAIVQSNTVVPVADAGPDFELSCTISIITLDGSASSQGINYTYLWTTGNGHILSGEETLTPEVDAPGAYSLLVTDTLNGCQSNNDEVIVTANTLTPGVEATGGTVTCFEPEIQLSGVFDTMDVTFVWTGPSGFASQEQNPVVTIPGNYTLSVTDTLNGCVSTATAIVEKLGVDPELTTTGGTINCSNSSVQLTVEAQIGGIVWAWAGDNGFTSTEQNPVVTQPGIYSVLAIDTVFGCIALDTAYVVTDFTTPVADAGPGLSFDCNILNAYLDGSASSQGANITYLWTTTNGHIAEGETTLAPFVDVPGSYVLMVTNVFNGCTATSEVVVSQIAPVTATVSFENVTCYNTATGSATVTPGGGDGVYTVAWSSGSLQAIATNLVAGNYTTTVTDGSGCTATSSITISQPAALHVYASATGQSLANVDDGTATAEPEGGTAPYSFAWNNGEAKQTLTDLAPGAYTVIVTDANGCTAIATANVNEFPCSLISSIEGTDAGCFGAANGSATVFLQNEIEPVSFAWSNGETSATADGLVAGIYTVSITDSTNCSHLLTVEISQPSEIIVSELLHEDVTCPDEITGYVIVGVNGGVQPYGLEWSTGSQTNSIVELGVGEYILHVTDGFGCLQQYTTSIIATDPIPPIVLVQPALVYLDENGVAAITFEQLDAGSSENCGIASISIDPENFDCSHLGTQNVTVTIQDLNGNESSGTTTVTVLDDQAPVLTCPANLVVSACNAVVEFEMPQISDNCAIDPDNFQQTAGLPSGSVFPQGVTTQTFIYTDAAGNAGVCSFKVELVEQLDAAYSIHNVSCNSTCDGSTSLLLSGGILPFDIVWSNGATGETLTGLCAGTYSATITDASGCEANVEVEIAEPAPLELTVLNIENLVCAADLTGAIAVEANGGTAPYSFLWSNGSTNANITNLAAGNYQLTGKDANGCTQTLSFEIAATDSEAPALLLQNVTVNIGANGSVTLNPALFDAGSTDNCGIVNWSISPASFGCSDAGSHQVTLTATDANGNVASSTATVNIVDNIAPTLTCPANIVVGFCNHLVMFTGPQVQDNCAFNPANLQQTGGLPSGSIFPEGTTVQTFSYTDNFGNTGTCSFTVTVAGVAILTANSVDPSCANTCDGSISLTITGGTAPYTVTWSNGQAGSVATGLCASTYSASVTDAAGCLLSYTTTISAPPALNLVIDQVTNDAGGAGVGAIKISVSGGTAPYTYTWRRNGQPFATTEDISNLLAGQYTVLVKDANGCEITSQTIAVDNINGTSEKEGIIGLELNPNPAKEWVRLAIDNPLNDDLTIQLFDLTGKLARSFSLAKGETTMVLDLTALNTGIYVVHLRTANNFTVRRLVVEK